jgi:hypothetical protein
MNQQHLNAADSARLEAMTSVVLADSLTACFAAKYHYAFWRPYTAIRAGDTDGNPATVADPNWLPLAPTPPHPEYPAAHGCGTQSIMTTLAAYFHSDNVSFSVFSPVTQTIHHFEHFSDVVVEVDSARIFGGMHYPHSVLQGNKMGKEVAKQMLENYFKPLH